MALKGLPYESIAVNLLKGEQNDLAFMKINPAGQVPCLVVDGRSLSESLAIIEWLDEVHPEQPFYPADPWVKAEIRSFVLMIAAGIQPLANLRVQQYVSKDAEKKTEWARHFIEEGMVPIENRLRERSSKGKGFAFGSELTIADIFLVPQVYNAHRFHVDMSRFPHAERIYESALKTAACDQAAPHNQREGMVLGG